MEIVISEIVCVCAHRLKHTHAGRARAGKVKWECKLLNIGYPPLAHCRPIAARHNPMECTFLMVDNEICDHCCGMVGMGTGMLEAARTSQPWADF